MQAPAHRIVLVQAIDANNCSLSGSMPNLAFQGIWLKRIDFSNNELSGSIGNTLTSYALQVCCVSSTEQLSQQ